MLCDIEISHNMDEKDLFFKSWEDGYLFSRYSTMKGSTFLIYPEFMMEISNVITCFVYFDRIWNEIVSFCFPLMTFCFYIVLITHYIGTVRNGIWPQGDIYSFLGHEDGDLGDLREAACRYTVQYIYWCKQQTSLETRSYTQHM